MLYNTIVLFRFVLDRRLYPLLDPRHFCTLSESIVNTKFFNLSSILGKSTEIGFNALHIKI